MTNQESTQVLEQNPNAPTDTQPVDVAAPALTITAEGAAYTALAALVLLLHLLQLGMVPLTVDEIPRALAAWQAVQPNTEITVLADSALLQLAHMLSFTIFGSTEAAARAVTAVVGFLLVFSPLLFRDLLGNTRTLMLTLLLACSPITLAGSRLDSPVIWQALFGVLAVWAVYRYVVTERYGYSVLATVLFVTTALLTGTTGHVTLLILLAAFPLAQRLAYSPDDEMDDSEPLSVGVVARSWAWAPGLGISALVVAVVATGFMLYPAGFNALAQSVSNGLAGWFVSSEGAPFLFGLSSSLLYEGFLWLFALIGVYLLYNTQDHLSFVDAYFTAWLIVGTLITILYQGTTAAHALWLTLPLAGLASSTAHRALGSESGFLWYSEGDGMSSVFGVTIPNWARWLIAATATLLFSLIFMHIGWLGRTLLTSNLSGQAIDMFNSIAPPVFFALVMVMLTIFSGFSFASLYGATETLRGGALGLLIVALFASLGSGWQVSVTRADDPRELWHTRAVGEEAFTLRETLLELSERETEGFPALEVTVVVDDVNIRQNGIVAWTLRDFRNATYVSDFAQARSAAVVLAPPTAEPPQLGGNYVGQSLVVSRGWDVNTLSLQGTMAWWFQRSTRVPPQSAQEVVLWLRQDIYDGVDIPGLQ